MLTSFLRKKKKVEKIAKLFFTKWNWNPALRKPDVCLILPLDLL